MGLIGNIISVVGNFISGAASSIGPGIAGFAKSSFSIIGKLPLPRINIVEAISTAAKIIHAVAEALGIKSEDTPEILGAKTEQSDKKLEDFDDNVESYINYLKDEVQLDKEKFDNLSSDEKLGCKAIGMALETKAVEEKIGEVSITPECLATLTKLQLGGINIDAKQLVKIVEILKSEGITNMNDVVEYLEGTGQSDRIKTGTVLAMALGDNAEDKIGSLKETIRKYEEE